MDLRQAVAGGKQQEQKKRRGNDGLQRPHNGAALENRRVNPWIAHIGGSPRKDPEKAFTTRSTRKTNNNIFAMDPASPASAKKPRTPQSNARRKKISAHPSMRYPPDASWKRGPEVRVPGRLNRIYWRPFGSRPADPAASPPQEQRAHQRARAQRQNARRERLLPDLVAQRADIAVCPFLDIVENLLRSVFGSADGLADTIIGDVAGIDDQAFHIFLECLDIVAQRAEAGIYRFRTVAVFLPLDRHDLIPSPHKVPLSGTCGNDSSSEKPSNQAAFRLIG
jgi:hypothetical protein